MVGRFTGALLGVILVAALAVPTEARPRARSLGDNSTGTLEGGRAVPLRSKSLRVITRTVKRGFIYGTDELVGALVDAAGAVRAALPGAVLHVGNLSREGGGDIGPSRSHNSGRDADLAFYLLDAKGTPAHPDGLVALGRDGRSRDGRYRLDLERNWALVRALLSHDAVQLEWAFCAAWLREMLLQHARAAEPDPALLVRAEVVLKQPGDSSPHDDHFHVRVYCAPDDRFDGCNGYGATWPWVDTAREDLDQRARELASRALGGQGRAKALEALVTARARAAVPVVLSLLAEPGSQDAVLRLVRITRAVEAAPALGERLAAATRAQEQEALVATLGALEAAAPLAAFASRSDASPSALLAAVRALGVAGDPVAVPALIALASSRDRALSEAAHVALGRLTNRTETSAGTSGSVDGWARWWQQSRGASRAEWVEAGFRRAGIPTGGYVDRVEALLRAVGSTEPHLSWNAQRELAGLTGLDLGARSDARAAASAWTAAWKDLRPLLAP